MKGILILYIRTLLVYILLVVNFLSQVIFLFPLFLGMVLYANEVETKKKIPEIKKLSTTYTSLLLTRVLLQVTFNKIIKISESHLTT